MKLCQSINSIPLNKLLSLTENLEIITENMRLEPSIAAIDAEACLASHLGIDKRVPALSLDQKQNLAFHDQIIGHIGMT